MKQRIDSHGDETKDRPIQWSVHLPAGLQMTSIWVVCSTDSSVALIRRARHQLLSGRLGFRATSFEYAWRTGPPLGSNFQREQMLCLNSLAERRKPQLACCDVFGLLYVAENLSIIAGNLSTVGLHVAYMSAGKKVDHPRSPVSVPVFELQSTECLEAI